MFLLGYRGQSQRGEVYTSPPDWSAMTRRERGRWTRFGLCARRSVPLVRDLRHHRLQGLTGTNFGTMESYYAVRLPSLLRSSQEFFAREWTLRPADQPLSWPRTARVERELSEMSPVWRNSLRTCCTGGVLRLPLPPNCWPRRIKSEDYVLRRARSVPDSQRADGSGIRRVWASPQ